MTALLRGVRLLAASAPQPATARAFGTARFSDPADDGDMTTTAAMRSIAAIRQRHTRLKSLAAAASSSVKTRMD